MAAVSHRKEGSSGHRCKRAAVVAESPPDKGDGNQPAREAICDAALWIKPEQGGPQQIAGRIDEIQQSIK